MSTNNQNDDKTSAGKSGEANAVFEEYLDEMPGFEPVMDEIDAVSAVAQSEAGDKRPRDAAVGIETKLETLIPNVLSMSESILQLAETSGELTDQLRTNAAAFEDIIADYDNLLQRKNRHMLGLLGTSVGVIFICLLLVIFMSLSFSRQVNNMNALSLTLGRRIAEVNSGLVTFEELNLSIGRLENAVLGVANGMQEQQVVLAEMGVQQGETNLQLVESIKAALAEQSTSVGAIVGGVQAEVARTGSTVAQSNSALQSLRLEVDGIGVSIAGLLEMRASLDALVTLEKERYLDQMRSQQAATSAAAAQQRDAAISFQREVPEPAATPSSP
jgi:hypothetical protein